ncbi:MAG: hypothetical protein HRU25_05095 [Psychrobium sp.]|nr:hypothetical protein [Psychrobium sp.]
MKVSFKVLLIGLTVALIYGVVFIFWGTEDKNDSIVHAEKQIVIVEGKQTAIVEKKIVRKNDLSTDVKALIQTLNNNAKERYKEILRITGSSGERNLSYGGDWCVAHEDLLEEEEDYAEEQLNEWKLSRGYTVFRGGKANALMRGLDAPNDEFPGINDEYLDPYREADSDTLLRLANNDDMIALTTILSTPGNDVFDEKSKFYTAKKLIILGDTSSGLSLLVIDRLVRAGEAKRLGKGRKHVKGYLKSALAYIEFGMMRKDVSSIYTYLKKSANYEEEFNGLNPSEYLTELDFIEIKKLARTYYEEANEARLEKGLPSFEEIDESNKITDTHYAETMFSYYSEFSELLEGNLLSSDWKKTYLQKTPCVERRIAMHNFRMKGLPAIQDEIVRLEESLN